jgi:hypothetical protein
MMEHLSILALAVLSTCLVAGCATAQVQVNKSAPATVNGDSVRWDNDWDTHKPGGFNLEAFEDLLKKQNVDMAQLVITIDRDERHCSAGKSHVLLAGRFTYSGQQGTFALQKDQAQHIGGVPSPQTIHAKCNHTAARTLAKAVIAGIQQLANPQPPPAQ